MKEKSKTGSFLRYGMGAIGLDLSYGLFYSFLSYYLSSVLGMKEGFLLILTPLARIWDGINDPMMGTIVDNTRTRFGKYRPWILIGAISNAIVLILLFTTFGLSGIPLYIYIAIMYILWGMTNTMADIPYWSMIPSLTSEEKERNAIATIARSFSALGQAIVLIGSPIILPFLSNGMRTEKGYSASGFSKWAMICGAALILFSLGCVLTTKEEITEISHEKKKFSFRKIFEVLKKNDQLMIFMLFAMLSNAGWYLTSGTAVYFFTDVLGNPKAQSLFQMIGSIGFIAGLFLIPILSKRFSRRTVYSISLGMTALGYFCMFLSGVVFKKTMILNFSYIFASIGISSMFVSQTIFLADIVDYGEYKNGERNESITFSMKGFLQKTAYTIQTLILFLFLGFVDYQEQIKAGMINEKTKFVIGFLAFGIPALFILLSLWVFRKKFRLYGVFAEEVRETLKKQRGEKKE